MPCSRAVIRARYSGNAGFALRVGCERISLCLCVSVVVFCQEFINHRDTEAQRRASPVTFETSKLVTRQRLCSAMRAKVKRMRVAARIEPRTVPAIFD